LNLVGFIIGLLVWFFSTLVISNAPSASDEITPPQKKKPLVDPYPYSTLKFYFLYSSSPIEISVVSNQVDKKKKKNKHGEKLPTNTSHVGSNQSITINPYGSVDVGSNPPKKTRMPKFPCSICKGDHLIKYFPSLPKVLEVWSAGPRQLVSSSYGHHVGNQP
jgi:hypothetical protein